MIERFEKFLYSISEINRYWHRIATDELKKYSLKGSYATYLTTMYRHKDGITASQLSDVCGKDKADVSRAMSVMEEKGLVKKASNNNYRALLVLTELGVDAAEHVRARASLAVETAGMDMNDIEREQFYSALESIVVNLQNISKQGLPE